MCAFKTRAFGQGWRVPTLMDWLVVAAFLLMNSTASAVSFDLVTVGDAGNACDVQSQGCFGAVPYEYRISDAEVTNGQYAEFLNAVAATDTYGLYDTNMQFPGGTYNGGITRSGSSGSFGYSAIAGRENKPVTYVSFYDSLRFANWLHNHQPTGAQDNTTTEDGAYTFSGATSVGARNAGAFFFLTSEDEWYKAAYYDGASMSYFDYPTSSDTQTICQLPPGGGPTSANCSNVLDDFTDVKSYVGSASSVSPYGTFDQGGNAWEWNEAIINSSRGRRGGSFVNNPIDLSASVRFGNLPTDNLGLLGFRVAAPIPEPSTVFLVMTGMLGLALWRRR